MTTVYVPAHLLSEIEHYGKQRLPFEACGVLFGIERENSIRISDWSPVQNEALSPQSHFWFHEQQWIDLLYCQTSERQIIGIFHSHPTKAPTLSETDREGLNLWQWPIYLIFSYANHQTSFQVYDKERLPLMTQVGVEIT